MKKLPIGIFLVTSFLVTASCSSMFTEEEKKQDPIDRASGLTRQDYLNSLTPKPEAPVVAAETKPPVVPSPADLMLNPQKPRLGVNKTVSLSVTEDVALKDVFIELARLADVDIEVDPTITGGVIFKAKNRPFDEVVERISDLAGLKYSVNNGVIRIESDKAYVDNYQLNFLNLVRVSSGQISANSTTGGTSSGNSGGGSSGGGSGSGSGSSSGSGGGGSSGSGQAGGIANGSDSNIQYKSGGDGDVWNSVVAGVGTIIGQANAGSAAGANSESAPININRIAGVLSVKATAKQHAVIKEYLDKVRDFYSSQVLIEAKVVEVSLNDQFRSGIDWNAANQSFLGGNVGIDIPGTTFPTQVENGFSTITFNSGDLNAVVKLAEVFGTTKTLSSPRILAMNNQQAALSFAKNENYFSLTCEVTDPVVSELGVVTTPAKLEVSSTLNSLPIGVILSLQPSIDSKNSQISMNIRPTLTRLTGIKIKDPAVTICAANAVSLGFDPDQVQEIVGDNMVPQVDVREMDSVLRMKNGEIMAIGGMIDQNITNTDAGVPVLSDIPLLGNAFKSVDKVNKTTQTVIFLKATIVPSGKTVDESDKNLYNKFNNDPRPLKF